MGILLKSREREKKRQREILSNFASNIDSSLKKLVIRELIDVIIL